jgi:hypothetical protein
MTKPTQFQSTDVLITVMTYPHPSRGYSELVCTAGITRSSEWIRLYPVDYRYRARCQQFHKYQWINVGLASRGAGNDNRSESRRPDLDSIRILGPPLSSDDAWRERREIIEKMPVRTVNQLRGLYESARVSIGIVRPTEMLDLEVEPADPEWKPEWQALFNQLTLFGDSPKDLGTTRGQTGRLPTPPLDRYRERPVCHRVLSPGFYLTGFLPGFCRGGSGARRNGSGACVQDAP